MCFIIIASICQYDKDFLSSLVRKQKVALSNIRPLKNSLKQVRVTLCFFGTNKTKQNEGEKLSPFQIANTIEHRGHSKAKLPLLNTLVLYLNKIYCKNSSDLILTVKHSQQIIVMLEAFTMTVCTQEYFILNLSDAEDQNVSM